LPIFSGTAGIHHPHRKCGGSTAVASRARAVVDTLAALIADHRDPSHITHTVADVLRARMLAIGCGYPDGDLCSQPTISRWENAPTLREIIRLTYALSISGAGVTRSHPGLLSWTSTHLQTWHFDRRCSSSTTDSGIF
jgi:hypothetical protein